MASSVFRVMKHGLTMVVVALLVIGAVTYFRPVAGGLLDEPWPLPEFTQTTTSQWIHSPPISVQQLKGQVVLLDFWTFDCWNCYRSFPWLNDLEQRYQDQGLQIIGIHTPEFDHEKIRSNVVAKMQTFQLHHPVMLDNDFRYWKALNNRYWPAFYLIDKQGLIRATFIGETHAGDANARQIEIVVRQLLAE